MLNPFDETSRINDIAGNHRGDPLHPDSVAIEAQLKLIQDELNEAHDNFEAGNYVGLRDDICDVLFTAYGLGHRMGFPTAEDYAEVCRSNMTKFDRTEDDALLTRAKYQALGVRTHYEWVDMYESPAPSSARILVRYYVTKVAETVVGSDQKTYRKGKWLKSVHFEEPRFSPLAHESTHERATA